jgi:hypothetical protein
MPNNPAHRSSRRWKWLRRATQLAEQADADAQLAEATAQRQKSHKAAMEFDASMQALRQESQRSTSPN